MRFSDKTKNELIIRAITIVEKLIEPDSVMMKEIKEKNDWTYTNDDGYTVWLKIVHNDKTFTIDTYKPWNRWSRVVGYFQNDSMYINSRKLPFMTLEDVVGNTLHELVGHGSGYGHGNNYYNSSKANSIPYWLSLNAKRWL